MKYIYQFHGGRFDGRCLTEEEANRLADGRSEDLSKLRDEGCLVHRPELDNQPTFKDYFGPMWDGVRYTGLEKPATAVIRYESPEVYDILSR